MSVAVAILGLAFLVLIHEAGHFFVARAVHMRPRKFYLGFPPAIAKVTRNGIEYGIGAIPLGGYVRIPGMHRPAPSDLEAHFGRALSEEPKLLAPLERTKRALEADDFDTARGNLGALREALDRGDLSAGPRAAAERGLTDIEDALAPDAYWAQRAWKRIAVIFAGPGTNLLLAIAIFTALLMIPSSAYRLGFILHAQGQSPTRVVDAIVSGSPAQAAGLRPGDSIVAIDGQPVQPDQIRVVIGGSKGRPLTLTVLRKGQRVVLRPARARKDPGVSAPSAVWQSVKLTGVVTRETAKYLVGLAHGKGRKEVSSPVGIVRESSHAAQAGLREYLVVLGFISLSLALLNLLPLLPLDGGHIAFSVIEGLRGRAVGREIYERVSAVGLVLVLLLFFVGLSNDLGGQGGG